MAATTQPAAAAPTAAGASLIADALALDAADAPAALPELDAAGQPIPPAPVIDFNREARMMLDTAAAVAGPFWPSVPRIWTDSKKAAVAAALGPVLEKYGLTLGNFMGQWQAEFALAMVAGPIVLETVKGIRADRLAAAIPPAPGHSTDQPPAAPIADPVSLG